MKNIINELQSIDVDLNWYFENSHYSRLMDSQFNSIFEKVKRKLRKSGDLYAISDLESALCSIEMLTGQIDYLIDFVKDIESSKPITTLKPNEQFQLINEISYHLQSRMTTTEINTYLSAFSVKTEKVNIVPSKRVYVQELLNKASSDQIIEIANSIDIKTPNSGLFGDSTIKNLIESKDLKSITADFNRAVSNIEVDPDLAIASASSTLESICKCIIELEGSELPKKQTMSQLVSYASKILNLSPNDHDNGEVKRVLGGIQNVMLGIGALRTGYSSAHGHGLKRHRINVRHVRMLVNSMATYGTFFLETYFEQASDK